jgi:hypothetical protein
MNATDPVEMTADDFLWAAKLMESRRERQAGYSPVFWRPARGVVDSHAQFLRFAGTRPDALALRTARGFIIASPQDGRCFVDDFAVEDDALWASDGKALLLAAWRGRRTANALRVVTARRDEPKRRMLIELGLKPHARWWVKELTPSGAPAPYGAIRLGDVQAQLVRAPPVYDPGGPVCLLGDLDPGKAASAAERAGAAGAVLAILQRDGGDAPVAEREPALEAAGYHNPAEFYQGRPPR